MGRQQVEHVPDAGRRGWPGWQQREAGPSGQQVQSVQVWRHTHDPSSGGTGVFLGAVAPSVLDRLELWTAYIVASRGPDAG